MTKATTEDIISKLRTEKETYDHCLTDKMKLHETLVRCEEELKLDTQAVEEQDKLLAELKKQIEAEQALVDALEETAIEAKKVNKTEEERHRRVQQEHTALTAKMEFIEDPEHYDYTSTPEDIGKNLHLFKDLQDSNSAVNATVDSFKSKVNVVKEEVKTILMKRRTY